MTPPILNHTRVAASTSQPGRWLYLLHGIYGSGRNWASLARQLVEQRPDWGIILVDLRLHGGSTGFPPPHTLRACVDDLLRLEDSLGQPASGILGHSFGGKVAISRAAQPEGLEQLWVVDSTLEPREPAGSAWRIVEIVRDLPDELGSRDEVVEALESQGYERGVGQWLAMNLERDGDRFRWRLDWEGVEAMLRGYFQADVWATIEEPPPGLAIHVIRATESDSLDSSSLARIVEAGQRTEQVHLHEVTGGHWLNVENPEAVVAVLASGLSSSAPAS